MRKGKFTHKLGVCTLSRIMYDVAIGDIVEVEYENGALSIGVYVGKLIEISTDYISIDSSTQYVSKLHRIMLEDIVTIKPINQ